MTTMDEATRRAWRLHFEAVARDYESQARRSLAIARGQRSRERRAYFARDARRLWRAAPGLRNHHPTPPRGPHPARPGEEG